MSALGKLLLEDGHIVYGIDVKKDFYTCIGLENAIIYDFDNYCLYDDVIYVIGNAYHKHKIVEKIKTKRYKYSYYPQFLVNYFRKNKWICVAGTHGKTTTTKLIGDILKDCNSIVGDGSFKTGKNYFLLEACEYKKVFLNYKPSISLILNVDYDHVDCYKTKEEYDKAFEKFIDQSSVSIVNGDSFKYKSKNVISFGMNDYNDIVFKYNNGVVEILNKKIHIPIKGLEYAYDFVGAYLVLKLLNYDDMMIQLGFDNYIMPLRRHNIKKDNENILLLDYAHHPNEILSIYNSIIGEYSDYHKICIFEPHTISRFCYFFDEYKKVLSLFDESYLIPLFSSVREKENQGLIDEMYRKIDCKDYISNISKIKKTSNSIICFLGAGRIDEYFDEYLNIIINTQSNCD